MPRIKPLSTQLANQIAAGEVVERPASVLKELLENAIDAGSAHIDIDISQGGKSLICVKDNGKGIDKEDLPLAVSRHATSKISLIDDLNHIMSLGFRGEALASISSISRLSISSKSEHGEKAWSIDTGSDTDFANYTAQVMPAALSEGTLINVYDLFYNTPARRKFLKTDKTEFRYLEEIFKRIALSHYEISFRLSHNGKLLKKLSKAGDNKLLRIGKLLGENLLEHLQPVDEVSQKFDDLGCLHLSGWVSKATYFRAQADQQFFYINGRFVRDKLVNHALRQAYQETLPTQQYMAYILYLDIDPIAVDVNVHPSKYEVRFNQPRMIHDFIVSCISRCLMPAIAADYTLPFAEQSQANVGSAIELVDKPPGGDAKINHIHDPSQGMYQLYHKPKFDTLSPNILQQQIKASISTDLDKVDSEDLNEYRFEGKILTQIGSIILAEDNKKLCFIDCIKMAKAINSLILEEQVTFHSNHVKFKTHRLLIPENIILSTNSCDVLLKYQTQLGCFGLDYTFSGAESMILRGLPKLPFEIDIHLMLDSVVKFLSMPEPRPESLNLDNSSFDDNFIALMLEALSQSIVCSQDFSQKQQLILYYINRCVRGDILNMDKFRSAFRMIDNSDLSQIIRKL